MSGPPTFDGGALPSNTWQWMAIPGSECGSGSTAGLAIKAGPSSDDVFVFFQGGGACWNQGSCVPSLLSYGPLCYYTTSCLVNAQGGTQPTAVHVIDSDPYPVDGGGALPGELGTLDASRILGRESGNPFANASFVYFPYCTGDLHAGRSTATYQYKYNLFDNPSNYTMHFSGSGNVDRYLERLEAIFPAPKRVWVVGVSGGGYGATLNFAKVRAAFPNAEVSLLADSSPMIWSTQHWPQWHDVWNLDQSDAGFPDFEARLLADHPGDRMALLARTQDQVITWFFDGAPGPDSFLNPPYSVYTPALAAEQAQFDATQNAKYFVLAGTEHVLIQGYGTRLADGGWSAPFPGPDGGVDLKQFIDDWATGAPGWSSEP